MDNQRDKQGQYVPAKGEYPRAELEGVQSYMGRDKRIEETKRNFVRNRVLCESEVMFLLEEIERLQQKLSDYEGCKGVEEYYAVVSKNRELQAKVDRQQQREQTESSTAFWAREGLVERLRLQSDAAIEHNARLLAEVSQLREERDKSIEGLKSLAYDLEHNLLTYDEVKKDCIRYLSELGVSHETP